MTIHVYITINLFNLCQQSFLPFYIYFFKCWHRLNEPMYSQNSPFRDCHRLQHYIVEYIKMFINRLQHYTVEYIEMFISWCKQLINTKLALDMKSKMDCFFLQVEINLKLDCTVQTVYHVHLPNVFSPFDNEESVIPLSTALPFMSIIVLFVMPFSSCVGWVHHNHDCGGAYKG
jgi:hypothetical protein